MERRQVLRWLALGGGGSLWALGQRSFGQAAIARETGTHWGYVGEGNPQEWGDLSPEYGVCGLGREQSPIDLRDAIQGEVEDFTVNYQPVPLQVLNNGHTMQVDGGAGNSLSLDGEVYGLRQFHFHHPSEHTLDGVAFPMEMHWVHGNDRGDLVVLGVFLAVGEENRALAPLWAALPPIPGARVTVPGEELNLAALLPNQRGSFRYYGSLTTPPCTEVVHWLVLSSPLVVSQAQVDRFRAIFPMNARPVQPRYRRVILRSP